MVIKVLAIGDIANILVTISKYVKKSKIQKKFLWKNSQNMNLKLESMFENIKNS